MRSQDKPLHATSEHEALTHVLENWRSCAGHLDVLAVQVLGLTASLPAEEAETIRQRLHKTRVPDLAVPNAELFNLELLHRRVEEFKAHWATRHATAASIQQEPSTAQ